MKCPLWQYVAYACLLALWQMGAWLAPLARQEKQS